MQRPPGGDAPRSESEHVEDLPARHAARDDEALHVEEHARGVGEDGLEDALCVREGGLDGAVLLCEGGDVAAGVGDDAADDAGGRVFQRVAAVEQLLAQRNGVEVEHADDAGAPVRAEHGGYPVVRHVAPAGDVAGVARACALQEDARAGGPRAPGDDGVWWAGGGGEHARAAEGGGGGDGGEVAHPGQLRTVFPHGPEEHVEGREEEEGALLRAGDGEEVEGEDEEAGFWPGLEERLARGGRLGRELHFGAHGGLVRRGGGAPPARKHHSWWLWFGRRSGGAGAGAGGRGGGRARGERLRDRGRIGAGDDGVVHPVPPELWQAERGDPVCLLLALPLPLMHPPAPVQAVLARAPLHMACPVLPRLPGCRAGARGRGGRGQGGGGGQLDDVEQALVVRCFREEEDVLGQEGERVRFLLLRFFRRDLLLGTVSTRRTLIPFRTGGAADAPQPPGRTVHPSSGERRKKKEERTHSNPDARPPVPHLELLPPGLPGRSVRRMMLEEHGEHAPADLHRVVRRGGGVLGLGRVGRHEVGVGAGRVRVRVREVQRVGERRGRGARVRLVRCQRAQVDGERRSSRAVPSTSISSGPARILQVQAKVNKHSRIRPLYPDPQVLGPVERKVRDGVRLLPAGPAGWRERADVAGEVDEECACGGGPVGRLLVLVLRPRVFVLVERVGVGAAGIGAAVQLVEGGRGGVEGDCAAEGGLEVLPREVVAGQEGDAGWERERGGAARGELGDVQQERVLQRGRGGDRRVEGAADLGGSGLVGGRVSGREGRLGPHLGAPEQVGRVELVEDGDDELGGQRGQRERRHRSTATSDGLLAGRRREVTESVQALGDTTRPPDHRALKGRHATRDVMLCQAQPTGWRRTDSTRV
ncbi:hypothetical protein CALCODRAFT_81082 [Calocera cornea HHB12733]|uniref:Uncharacterized protein n=1 Tax=Calocera cornea HHB12733 TaxID=1353952 RepID=A0A165DEH6_9BASI|nr:hypothetical protein CALCODRAFT_81082 [Calocera cornea HHB12733]